MGFFRKKEDRVYPLQEAIRLLKTEKYKNYTTIPVGNGYQLVSEEKVKRHIEVLKIEQNSQRTNFINGISENGLYGNLNIVPSHYNGKEVKRDLKQNQIR